MPYRRHNYNPQAYAAFPGLLGVGENVQTAPRRDVTTSLPVINEGSIGTRSSGSSVEFAAGRMDLDEDERARLRSQRRRQKKLHLEGRTSQILDDYFTKCRRCNLWINCKDQALHRKGCPTLSTSPVNISRDLDYHRPIPSTPSMSSQSSSDPYSTRGRSGYPGSPQAQRLSHSMPRTPSIRIPDPSAGRSHDYQPFHDVTPIVSRPAPPYTVTTTVPPPYTSYAQLPYHPYPPGIPPPLNPPATALPIYPAGHSRSSLQQPQHHQRARSSQYLAAPQPFAHLENDPYRSRSYGYRF